MDHKLFRSKISEYMDKKLSTKELAEFDKHAKACPECLLELQMTVKAVKELKRSPRAKEQELPVNFYAKLGVKLDAADTEKQNRKSFIYTPWFRAAAMSFALILIAVMVRQITKSPEFMGNRGFDKEVAQEAEIADKEQSPAAVVEMSGVVAAVEKKEAQLMEERKADIAPAKAKKSAPAYRAAMAPITEIKEPVKKMEYTSEKPSLSFNYDSMEAQPQANVMADLAKDESASGVVSDKMNAMSTEKAPAAGLSMAVKTDYNGTQSGVETFQGLAFTNVKTWDEFITRYPALDRVTVDFNTQMVVAIFLGTKPTAGYNVMITDVYYETDKVLVKYIVAEPIKGTLQAQVITTPYYIKVVKKSSLRVQFER